MNGMIEADKKKASKLAIRADYYEVTCIHYTYDKKGKQTGKSEITFYAPIANTAEYYIAYK